MVGLGFLASGFQREFFSKVPPNQLFGPFDGTGCKNELIFGLLQVLFVLCLAFAFTKLWNAGNRRTGLNVWSLVVLTVVDIGLANFWLLAQVPSECFTAAVPIHDALQRYVGNKRTGNGPLTIYRCRDSEYEPKYWAESSSNNRLEEIVFWQRETLFPKHHLAQCVRLIGSFSSIWPKEYERLLKRLNRYELNPFEGVVNVLKGTRILERHVTSASGSRSKQHLDFFAYDPARCQDNLELVVKDLDDEFISDFEWFINRRRFAHSTYESGKQGSREAKKNGNCQVVSVDTNKIELEVDAEYRQRVTVAILDDGNWRAKIKNRLTGDEVIQPLRASGVQIEGGEYFITFFYHPTKFWIGAWVSGLSWLSFSLCFIARWLHGLRDRNRLAL